MNVDSLHREYADALELNDIGRVEVTTAQPLFYDQYRLNRGTGSFILVDPHTNATVAAGMIRGPVNTADEVFGTAAEAASPSLSASPGAIWEEWNIGREAREARNGHPAAVVWFTGLSGAGKSTIAREVERRLFDAGCQTMLLDGDQLRHGLCGDLGFSAADRTENIRRAAEAARLFFEHGNLVLCTFVSPYAADRARTRAMFPGNRFLEVHVECDVAELRRRDTKGLYARFERGQISGLTGVDAPYEPPAAAEIRIDTADRTVEACVQVVIAALRDADLLGRHGGSSALDPLPGDSAARPEG